MCIFGPFFAQKMKSIGSFLTCHRTRRNPSINIYYQPCYSSLFLSFDLSPPLQDCGADCAKFQKSELEYKFNQKALARPYTSKNSWGKTYGEHKRHLEFSHDQYRELQKYAKEVGIFFTASGMDEVRKRL